mgnify:CR=1 FL=1
MSKIKSNTAAAKSTEAVEVAPKAKVVQNPANATARTTYEPVVYSTGTIGGKPARLAWYGTKYGCIEIEQADGTFTVHHDTAFGGMRSVAALEGLFDSVAPDVLVLGGDMREIQLTAGNVAVVEPEIVEVVDAEPVVVELDPVDFAKAEANIAAAFPAPVIAAEPVYTTLDEVRAAHEAETRGACRASVLRALRVRAGEISLGVTAGGAKRVKPESESAGGEGKRTARMGLVEMLSKGIVKVGDEVKLRTKEGAVTTLSEGGNAADGRSLSQWATDHTGVSHNVYRSFIHVPTGKPLDDLRE